MRLPSRQNHGLLNLSGLQGLTRFNKIGFGLAGRIIGPIMGTPYTYTTTGFGPRKKQKTAGVYIKEWCTPAIFLLFLSPKPVVVYIQYMVSPYKHRTAFSILMLEASAANSSDSNCCIRSAMLSTRGTTSSRSRILSTPSQISWWAY